ncbi:MAG: PEP/pyruvate-binding domain-containing protein [Acidobacteriota bacterium]|jgi:CheY-like chemotaxis protein
MGNGAERHKYPSSFQDLMLWRIDKVLLVSSLYDSFMLSEDRLVNELVLGDFLGLDLYNVPDLTRVSTGREALQLVQNLGGYDLIISATQVGDMDADELARRVHDAGLDIPVIVLAYHDRELNDFIKHHDLTHIERTFLFQGDIHILFAIVKYVEDRMNVAHDVDVLGVQTIIVIEDNIRYYSSFLPSIYTEVMQHTRSLVPEGVNLSHKLLRIKARPKILLCDTYEEAWNYFWTYRENVLGVVSDVEFPKDGVSCPDAGLQFAEKVRELMPDVPVVLQSGKQENEALAHAAGRSFLLKGSPTLLRELRKFMLENFGFGDFVFLMPDGTEVGRAQDLKSLERELRSVPAESISYHAERNQFSVWLKAHTEFGIAHRLRPRKLTDFADAEELRNYLIHAIRTHREERRRAVVADFDPDRFNPERGFARLGGGSLGGKARGLAFANLLLTELDVASQYPDVRIAVPPTVVIGTEVFDDFLDVNELRELAITSTDDDEIVRRFLAAELPEDIRSALRAFLDLCYYPLAVRSSSLLEDSRYQPFAGIYETLMVPNNSPDLEERLQQLLNAIKRVFASTFTQAAKRHLISTSYRLEEEKMGVILQRIVGAEHDGRFYPEMAGVALSQNYYPVEPIKADDGLVAVALGLGPAVVEGEDCLRFSPRHPERLVQMSSVKDALDNSQRQFYALNLEAEGDAVSAEAHGEEAQLGRYDLAVAEKDGTLAPVGSTYSRENDAIYDGISRPGVRLVSFAPVLKYQVFPLTAILGRLLEISVEAAGGHVEIEFAVNLSTPRGQPKEFGFLQLRPVAASLGRGKVEIGDFADVDTICRSTSVLGNGVVDGIRDIVAVDYERYERGQSRLVAQEVARYNAQLVGEGVRYLLIGVGRWGSADPLLGIPVSWDQIDGAKVIVEAGFRDFKVQPSQGTHFFQNLVANNIGYFTANPDTGDGWVDWEWLASQPSATERTFTRHLRLDQPVVIKMNGARNEGVVLKPGIDALAAGEED